MKRRKRHASPRVLPQLAVKRPVPRYRKFLIFLLIGLFSFWLGWRMAAYQARSVGQTVSQTGQDTGRLTSPLKTQKTEMEALRRKLEARDSALQLERSTARQLSERLRELEAENATLRENVALFDSLSSNELVPDTPDFVPEPAQTSPTAQPSGIRIQRFQVERQKGQAGVLRYELHLTRAAADNASRLKGRLQFLVRGVRAGKAMTLTFPPEANKGDTHFAFELKSEFRRQGLLQVPSQAQVKTVEVRLLRADGSLLAKRSASL